MSKNQVEAIEKRNKEYLESLQGNIGKYFSFLSTMARFHKYEVKDLASFVLEAPAIYTAVASEELWKKHFNRKISAKARGITLIKNGKPTVYYDVSETESQNNYEVKLWQYDETRHKRFLNAVVLGETDTKKQIRIISEEMARRSDATEKDQKIIALSVEAVILERMGLSTDNATRQLARLSFDDHDVVEILEKTQETAKEFLDAMQRAVSQDEFSEENVNKPKNNPLLQEIGVIRVIKESELLREEEIELEGEPIQSNTFDNFEVEQAEESINQENVTDESSEYISSINDDEIENSFDDEETNNFVEENAEQEEIESIDDIESTNDDEESAKDENVYAEDENIVNNEESEENNELEDDVETSDESEEIEENQVDGEDTTSNEEVIESSDDEDVENIGQTEEENTNTSSENTDELRENDSDNDTVEESISEHQENEIIESNFESEVENIKDDDYDAENSTTEVEKTNDTDDNKKDDGMVNIFEYAENNGNFHQTDPDYDYEEDEEMEEEEEILPEVAEVEESEKQEFQEIIEGDENESINQVENAENVEESTEEVKKSLKETLEEDMLEIQGNSREKTTFRNNVIAIRTLQNIKSEKRDATEEDKAALKAYSGFGGIPKAFDKTNPEWSREAWLLEKILTKKEYEAARGSTLNAHYTSTNIIHGMYEGLEKLGFKQGTILEPSMGVGRFFGEMPEEMKESSYLYGVELDSLTGEIAKILYPEAEINIQGFEKTKYVNNSFDIAVGNVPFGSYKVNDKDYNGHGFLIHDYFIAKMIDQVQPGGIVAVITSRGTLDKKDRSARKYFAERADLIKAIKLPNNAFKEAGTEVTSDILFFKKLETSRTTEENLPSWVNTGLFQGNSDITLNKYFEEHPEDILGTLEMTSTAYGYDLTCNPDERSLDEALSESNDVNASNI